MIKNRLIPFFRGQAHLLCLYWSGRILYLAVLGFLSVNASLAGAAEEPVLLSTASAVVPELFQWPVARTIDGHPITIVSPFGRRKAPGTGLDEAHEGVDWGVPLDVAVHAAKSGKVLFAGFSSAYVERADKKQKDRLVIVLHSDGRSSRYVHIDRLRVHSGELVATGQILGMTSESDEWSQPVLHFEIRTAAGKARNPIPLLESSKTVDNP